MIHINLWNVYFNDTKWENKNKNGMGVGWLVWTLIYPLGLPQGYLVSTSRVMKTGKGWGWFIYKDVLMIPTIYSFILENSEALSIQRWCWPQSKVRDLKDTGWFSKYHQISDNSLMNKIFVRILTVLILYPFSPFANPSNDTYHNKI